MSEVVRIKNEIKSIINDIIKLESESSEEPMVRYYILSVYYELLRRLTTRLLEEGEYLKPEDLRGEW